MRFLIKIFNDFEVILENYIAKKASQSLLFLKQQLQGKVVS